MTQDVPKPEIIMKYMGTIAPAYAMMAGMQLDIFTTLKDGALTVDEVADMLGVRADKLIILLRALVAAELLTYAEDKFENTAESAFYLVDDGQSSIGASHPFIKYLWDAMPHTAESIRQGIPQARHDWHMADISPELAAVTHAYHLGGLSSAKELLSEIDLSAYKHIADIGGGTGSLAIGLTEALPELHVTIIDLVASISLAENNVPSVPQKDRIHLQVNDMTKSPPDGTFEAAILKSFTQVLSEEQNRVALKHTFDAIEAGGMIYIDTAVLDEDGITPTGTAIFNLIFLNLYEEGQAYTESKYHTWLAEAGFVDIKRHYTKDGGSIMIAKKPKQ